MGEGGGLRAYAVVLRRGPVVRPFAAALLARLPLSMAPLGTVLLVQDVRGSYAAAGLVTGAFAAGTAVGSPVWGRAMDRFGQARVIVPTVLLSAGLLVALAVGAVAGAPDAALVALAAASGATTPPFSAAMRASWRVLLPDPVQRRAGYAMDAAAVESIFVMGPLLLSVLLVLTPPVAPLLITAGLLTAGGLLYAGSGPARRPAAAAGDAPGSAGASPVDAAGDHLARASRRRTTAVGLLAILGVSLAMSVGFGAVDTSLAATARTVLHDEGRLGTLFAAIAGGSTLGGLAYGTVRGHEREHRRLPLLLGGFAAGLVLLALLLVHGRPSWWALLPLLFVVGLTISPSLIIQQNLVDHLAPPGRVSEAQAWLSTSVTTGAAAGTAAAGALIQAVGVSASFAAGAAAVTTAAVVALGSQPSFRAVTSPPAGVRPSGAPPPDTDLGTSRA